MARPHADGRGLARGVRTVSSIGCGSPRSISSEMLRAAQVYEALCRFDGWDRVKTESAPSEGKILALPQRHATRRRQHAEHVAVVGNRVRITFAAIAAAVVVLLLIVYAANGGSEPQHRACGERREIVLSDGSILRMDPERQHRDQLRRARATRSPDQSGALFQVAKRCRTSFRSTRRRHRDTRNRNGVRRRLRSGCARRYCGRR